MALLNTHSNPIAAADLTGLIGNTPLLRFRRLTAHLPEYISIYAKAEWTNPGGSVKDRAAWNIIRQAEQTGALKPGQTLVDSTSGNTGIAYAMLGAARGYPVRLFVPANASPERLAILRAYGAELVLTDPLEGSDGAILAVRELVENAPGRYFYANQYNNPANWLAHYETTGPEIWRQTQGKVTHFVAGLGTTGTFIGTGRYLKQRKRTIRLIALQPDDELQVIEGLKYLPTAIRPGIYDETLADRNLGVSAQEAWEMTRRLARRAGLFAGLSAGAAVAGALHVARELDHGVVVTLLPDDGSKYLSLGIFDHMENTLSKQS